jgi:hypothetical protein
MTSGTLVVVTFATGSRSFRSSWLGCGRRPCRPAAPRALVHVPHDSDAALVEGDEVATAGIELCDVEAESTWQAGDVVLRLGQGGRRYQPAGRRDGGWPQCPNTAAGRMLDGVQVASQPCGRPVQLRQTGASPSPSALHVLGPGLPVAGHRCLVPLRRPPRPRRGQRPTVDDSARGAGHRGDQMASGTGPGSSRAAPIPPPTGSANGLFLP